MCQSVEAERQENNAGQLEPGRLPIWVLPGQAFVVA